MEPHILSLADQLLLIERELRRLGMWTVQAPSASALASTQPFCIDTLPLEQWLQWIFLPRMKLILESADALPRVSGILPMAELAYQGRGPSVAGLLQAIESFDRLITEVSERHEQLGQ